MQHHDLTYHMSRCIKFHSALGHVKEPTIVTSTSSLPIVKYETLYVRHVKLSMRYECRMKNGDDRALNGSFESFELKIAILFIRGFNEI